MCVCVCVCCVCAMSVLTVLYDNICTPLIVIFTTKKKIVSSGTDPEDVIRNAFACFDEEATGHINEDR